MNRRCLALSVLAALWLAGRAAATTYVVVPDERLADEATVVVDGTVEAVRGVPGAATPMTEYVVRVERTLKGRVTDGSVSVRVLGGRRADGKRLHVWGGPTLQPGERALLFLVAHDDGAFRPLHFGLGAFHEARRSGRALALRDLGQAQVLAPDGRETLDRMRDFDGFSRWVADRSAGLRRAQDYFVDLPAGPSRAVEPFTFLGGQPHRWFEFDGSQSISWRAHQNGQPGVAGGGFAEFQAAINAWNGDAGSNVRYRYDGTTVATSGFKRDDGVNSILFEDPNNEIGGAFACTVPGSGSGTLAIGGAWSDDEVTRNGFLVILEGDIVMNDGVGCWFVNGKRAEQVYGHELGHTLGLGHSCGDEGKPCNSNLLRDALMRATAHRDDRGARLNDDDRAGIRFLYPQSGNSGGGAGKPAAPSGLTAVTQSASSVLLAWTDNANNETNYRVERKTNGGWTQLPLLPAGSTSFTVTGLTAATSYTFRVRAKNSAGFSGYSNEAAATTQAGLPAAPAGLTAERIAGDQIRLAWQDRSGNETAFAVEVTSPFHAGFVEIATAAANATTYVVSNLDADVPYTFRVRARNANGNSAPTNLASATIPAPVACGTVSSDLCLLGGRFRVFVHWKLGNGQIGDATAVPDSDQTGFFYFFGEENIELIVKILDARTINQAFWTFYGGLSDVEYWVSVIDTVTGDSATYRNAPGNLCGRADVGAFPQSASTLEALALDPAAEPLVLAEAPATATTEAACAPGTLCLLGGRFQVEATFEKDGATQKATAVPYGDGSGFFWFFSSANTELVVKVIDGRGINGKFWFFYGALSDVEYDIKVTDTVTGAVKTYHNAQGNLCGRADTTAF
ncbi:MAG TPA: fibronectin type III domain-containing protein [Thermoanaerobaculia bacterium]|nr:fibronectin type III domain-containing protein [Thermoanaerobaculia bacterium]